ncbi:quinone-dependent dihydroorotate dehydrogenase [Candidatus Solirubrobacter pratensis]|uniref:quinone-dependent dihydroorotate dehydrogenase n=1 Tax=Candidatus Solirubrobacter pratensis TaxID=1298857 RepID=UPI0004031950|nr:quinone-dependent dihydroorotate dehydrogenase [Candidatus Solirubrobacter pratensis]
MLYRLLFRHVLTRIDAERVHALAATALRLATAIPALRTALRRWTRPAPELRVSALGATFPSPLGVPAGVDKGATWFEALGALGFGFVEVGTVTALAQPGNPPPRITRLVADRALLNSMGFPNPGAEATAARLRRRTGDTIVAANIGKSKAAPLEQAGADYRAAVRLVAPLSDFLVLNVSSPNTPGLRDMQAVDVLAALVSEVRAEAGTSLPLLVKIAPDLPDEQIDAIADLAVELGLDGIVATNTTLSRDGLEADRVLWEGKPGGISGAPLKARSLAVLERLHRRAGDRLTLVSAGGIETAEDAWERILAGASLVQAYTGFIYGGPAWPRALNHGLLELLRRDGYASVQDAIGAGVGGDARRKARPQPYL